MTAIRILIADDHSVVRTGLRLLLESVDGIDVVGEAGDGESAIEEARRLKPDVVLLDVIMPGLGGLQAAPQIIDQVPDVRIVMLSMQDDPTYVQKAFGAGASAYVLKEAADTELVAAVRDAAAGRRYVDPDLGARMIATSASDQVTDGHDALTDREMQVLRLLALGHTNLEIAGLLSISVRTAETHRAHVMRKLRLNSRAELVRYALNHRLLSDAPAA
jgi:two-component system, NarL family, response regulator NreC